MSRIIYSISGEGMGHAIRSKPIIEHLQKNHDIKIFSSGRAHSYLSNIFDDVNEIQGIYIHYKNNKVNEFKTFYSNFVKLGKIIGCVRTFVKVIKNFKPDLIISDFEGVSSYASLFTKTPILTIDNQHIFEKTKIKYPKKHFMNYLETRFVDKLIMIKSNYNLITTFFYPKIKSNKAFLFPPILRSEIIDLKSEEGAHFLVYQTSSTNKKLINNLKSLDHKFIVYGFSKDKKEKNLHFKKFNESDFYSDLASSKGIITNGGFTLITEALHLKKPILSIPVKRQFEQVINAIHLEKQGFGYHAKDSSKKHILSYIENLENYKGKLINYEKNDNSKLLSNLDSIINKL